jgi:LPS sulfotransferase NodH
MKELSNVIILGMGRSGTTLLLNMLHAHSQVAAPPESYFSLHLYKKYRDVTKWDDQIFKNFISDVNIDRPFRLVWKTSLRQIRDSISRLEPIRNYSDACNAVRLAFENQFNLPVEVIVDKNPMYSWFIDWQLNIHPKAKIIHLTRDPRGVVHSHFRTFGSKNISWLSHQWNNHQKQIKLLEKQSVDYIHVRYEDLTTEPGSTLKNIASFLNVDFEEQMLDHQTNVDKRFSYEFGTDFNKHAHLRQQLNPSIGHQWQKELDKQQISRINSICGPIAQNFGYDLAYSQPSADHWARMQVQGYNRLLRLYFDMPLTMRKAFLGLKSKFSDHKYN